MIFILKQFDKPLLTFSFVNHDPDGQILKIVSINEENKRLLPIGMESTDEGLHSWLRSRAIPKKQVICRTDIVTFRINSKKHSWNHPSV